ncbi:hypothetical protein HMSP1_8 [Sinorhizobium phage HMSP1-Susan]|nr:hypothetical protein HMSP1_8 [Sinorhizobium phage HMSP1-Susan]
MIAEITRSLWDTESQRYIAHTFVVSLDEEQLPVDVLQRAVKNKSGKVRLVHGALTVREKQQ